MIANDNQLADGVQLLCGDAFEIVQGLPDQSVHMAVTDGPYNFMSMGNRWDHAALSASSRHKGRVKLPHSAAFNKRQGPEHQAFTRKISEILMPTLMPGGFFLNFSQARLAPFAGVGMAHAGFELRDLYTWSYHGQAKAQMKDQWVRATIERFSLSAEVAAEFRRSLIGRKTAQLKAVHEAILLGQRPRAGTVTDNWHTFGVGLVDMRHERGRCPSQRFEFPKPGPAERRRSGGHLTLKPEALLRELILRFTKPGDTVLDCFMGTGTTGVAAIETGRKFIGIELDPGVFTKASRRISEAARKVEHAVQVPPSALDNPALNTRSA